MLFKLFLLNINLQNIGYNIFPLENYMTKINLIERWCTHKLVLYDFFNVIKKFWHNVSLCITWKQGLNLSFRWVSMTTEHYSELYRGLQNAWLRWLGYGMYHFQNMTFWSSKPWFLLLKHPFSIKKINTKHFSFSGIIRAPAYVNSAFKQTYWI